MNLDKINRLIAKRDALHIKWREQIAALDDSRNETAGRIYEADNAIRRAISEYANAVEREQYAASWADRWPR